MGLVRFCTFVFKCELVFIGVIYKKIMIIFDEHGKVMCKNMYKFEPLNVCILSYRNKSMWDIFQKL